MRAVPFLLLALALVLPPLVPAAVPVLFDDAGSGRDAPDTALDVIRIQPGVVYAGFIGGIGVDRSDYYAFEATAGDLLEARAWGPVGCISIHAPDGTDVDTSCVVGDQLTDLRVTATETGVWFVSYGYLEPHRYHFSLGINGAAPNPSPAGTSLYGGGGGSVPTVAGASQAGPHAVIAVVDTGINPYHAFFRAPALADHPSTWLAGFPANATSVALTLNAPDYATAVASDEAAWQSLRRSFYDEGRDSYLTHLYTFPGTRVVGAVSFGEYDPALGAGGELAVLDEHGHGTHSAGLAAGANMAAADGNVLVVMVEVGQGDFVDGVRWAARQPWIDGISVSLGVLANAPATFSPLGSRTGMEWATLEAAASGKPVFVASGNGFSGTGLVPDHCSTYTSPYTGPSWVTRVGAAEPASGNPTWWHCVPVEAVARTDVPSPDSESLDVATSASGTSAATPNLAGHFAHALLAARTYGVTEDRASVLQHLLNASLPAPTRIAFGAEPSLAATSPADQGYGLVDDAALERAVETLLTGAGPTPRPELDAWVAGDRALREQLWGPGSATSGEQLDDVTVPDTPDLPPLPDTPDVTLPGNDGGSGRDAGASPETAVEIQPGVVYRGTTYWPLDDNDWYGFDAAAGQELRVAFDGPLGCLYAIDPEGVRHADGCSYYGAISYTGGDGVPLTSAGRWHVAFSPLGPGPYALAITLDGSTPPDASWAG